MATCANGHENAEGQKFCGECGEPIPEQAPAVAEPLAPGAAAVPGQAATHEEEAPAGSGAAGLTLTVPKWLTVRRNQFIAGGAAAAVVLVVVLILVIGGGAGGGNNAVSSTQPAATAPPFTSPPATLPAVFAVGDKASFTSGATIQLYTYREGTAPSNQYTSSDPGMQFAVADVEFCAGSTTNASYNELGFHAQTPDNREYDSTYKANQDPNLSSGDVPAGSGCKRGYVGFQIPVGQHASYIVWDYSGWQLTRWKVP
jgi:Domain of unknown function (DUF4352)